MRRHSDSRVLHPRASIRLKLTATNDLTPTRALAYHPNQEELEHAKSIIVAARPLTLPRAGDVQDVDLVLAHKIDNRLRGVFDGHLRRVDQFVGAQQLLAAFNCEFSSAAQLFKINDERRVGILDVLQSALGEAPLL